jgi:hypothetical protein
MFRFFTRNTYRKELTIIIVMKVLALFLLWGLFFSEPIEHLNQHKMANHLLVQNSGHF